MENSLEVQISEIQRKDTEPLSLINIQEAPKDINELPQQVEFPESVTNYIKELIEKTSKSGNEQEGIVTMNDGQVQTKEILEGDIDSPPSLEPYWRSFLNKPALAYIHTHPQKYSSPSIEDLKYFKRLPKGASAYIIAAEKNVALILQTKSSMRTPISSVFNGLLIEIKATNAIIESARTVHEKSMTEPFNRKTAVLDDTNREEVLSLYDEKIAEICEQSGFGYYTFSGNATESDSNLILNKVTHSQ